MPLAATGNVVIDLLGPDKVIVALDRLVSYTKIMMPVDEALHQPSGAASMIGLTFYTTSQIMDQ